MGKGDKKTRRGKIFIGSYGVSRRRKPKEKIFAGSAMKGSLKKPASIAETEIIQPLAKPVVNKLKVKKPTVAKPKVKKIAAKKTSGVKSSVKKTAAKKTAVKKTSEIKHAAKKKVVKKG